MEELTKQLEDLEDRYFMLQMIDNWSSKDYSLSYELIQQIKATKQKIKDLEV